MTLKLLFASQRVLNSGLPEFAATEMAPPAPVRITVSDENNETETLAKVWLWLVAAICLAVAVATFKISSSELGLCGLGLSSTSVTASISHTGRLHEGARGTPSPQQQQQQQQPQAAKPATHATTTVTWMFPGDVRFPENAPTRALPGCPPPPDLCRFHHVFSEVLVISAPWRLLQWLRLSQQLSKHNISHSMVHAYWGSHVGFARLFEEAGPMEGSRGQPVRAGQVALLTTMLEVLSYIARSPHESVLLLEDDALLPNDDVFDAEFDRQIRLVPPDWKQLYLGLSNLDWNGDWCLRDPAAFQEMERTGRRRPFAVNRAWGMFAVAFTRSAAGEMLAEQLRRPEGLRLALDEPGQHHISTKYPGKTWSFWPFFVLPDLRNSTLRDNQPQMSLEAQGWRWRFNYSSVNLTGVDTSLPFPTPILRGLEGGYAMAMAEG